MTVDLSQFKNQEEKTLAKKEEIKKNHSTTEGIANFFLKLSRVPLKEKLFFVQHLSIMLKAGISLSSALNTLSVQSENKKFKKVISEIAKKVEKGSTFTEGLNSQKEVFGELFINMVEAGELSGKLEDVLAQLYIQLKKQHELTSKIKSALTYPSVILVAMTGIGIFMIVVVVPKITDMFKEFDAELPLPTKILIAVSGAIANNGLLALTILIASVVFFIKILKTEKGKKYFHLFLLKAPVISPIIKKINIARFSRTISSLLKTDIMIIKTFQITANVLGNVHYKNALMEMSERIKKGGQINEVIKNYPKLFPPVVTQMIAVGEETGEIDTILEELANFYEGEVDQIMSNLPSIIEPILILILGCGVGGVAVAIIMPMYSLTTAI